MGRRSLAFRRSILLPRKASPSCRYWQPDECENTLANTLQHLRQYARLVPGELFFVLMRQLAFRQHSRKAKCCSNNLYSQKTIPQDSPTQASELAIDQLSSYCPSYECMRQR